MKSIMILANKYPNYLEPNTCVFIQQLVWTFADFGYKCSVVCPLPINLNREYVSFPEERKEINENGNEITVYHPKYISMGQSGSVLQKQRVAFTTAAYEMAVERILKKIKVFPDILYAHFLCPTGVVASRLGKKYGIPAFMAHGEAIYAGNETYGNAVLAKELTGLKGVIAVSSQNKGYVVDAGIVPEHIVKVFPNGYRKERFYPRDKQEARKKFGFPEDVFLVGMCGSFDDRKGIFRIQSAVDQIPDVFFACAGKGEQMPTSSKCLWAKPVNNAELPWFYSALDIFVLPTQNEGCCNAIVEAIACGCPIISSDRPFNADICNATNSILTDPNNIEQIRNAIITLKENDEMREKLSAKSIEMAGELTLEQRAKNIIIFMENNSKLCEFSE